MPYPPDTTHLATAARVTNCVSAATKNVAKTLLKDLCSSLAHIFTYAHDFMIHSVYFSLIPFAHLPSHTAHTSPQRAHIATNGTPNPFCRCTVQPLPGSASFLLIFSYSNYDF
ncbi:hypothetical protein AN958_03575 [Leucoagaricus sp. SymC.cos]|nr:hypothetical protein AN958_03575 [Leucoagaricus sp. SymC.cos]